MAQIEKRASSAPATFEWEYAPAPESRDVVDIRERYGLFVGGEEIDPKSGEWFASISPRPTSTHFEVALANEADVELAVAAARGVFEDGWSSLAPPERAKYLYRLARLIQERSRELAVAESLDGGKPIQESRDVDVPLAAAHFFYYAGWADKLDYAYPGRTRGRSASRPDHPLELPAPHARVEDRAGTRMREHRRAEAGGDDAADGDDPRRDLPAGGVAAGRREPRDRGRLDRRDRPQRGDRQVAFTGSTEVGKAIMRELAGRDVRSPSSSAARPRTSSSTTRRSTRRSRASSTASTSTRATSAAPARGSSCRSRSTSRCSRSSSDA